MHRFLWIGVSGFLGCNPSSGITRSKGSSIFSFLRKFHTVFHSGCTPTNTVFIPTVCIPTNSTLGIPFLHSLSQPLLSVDLFMMAIPIDVKWYLIVVLICISLMASDVEHHFICLWALCMSSLEKCLFRSFASGPLPTFELGCWSSWSGVVWVLYRFWRSNKQRVNSKSRITYSVQSILK